MRINELVRELEKIKKKYGNIPVKPTDGLEQLYEIDTVDAYPFETWVTLWIRRET